VAIVESSSFFANTPSKPPAGGRFPKMPVVWAYWPRSIEVRDGQHSETLTR